MDITEQLAGTPLFRGLPDEHVDELRSIVVSQTVKRGETIFMEGEAGHGFYVVSSGKVKVSKISFAGKEQILHIFGPGEPFGEVPVFAGKNFPANAEALEDGKLLYFQRDRFIELIRSTPPLAMSMLALLSQRLHMFTGLIEDLSLKEVPGRLAAYLLFLREQQNNAQSVRLDMSKTQLAGLLGTIPETLSRILARLTDEGIITSEGTKTIQLDDVDLLQQLASGEFRLSKS